MAFGAPAFWWRRCSSVAPRADLAEAQEAINSLANLPADWAIRDVTLLRLRALLARARGDDSAYRDLLSRYRAMAESLGFEGHIAWAEAMR